MLCCFPPLLWKMPVLRPCAHSAWSQQCWRGREAETPTWCRTPSSPTHWVQASSGTQLPSSSTWFGGQKHPSEGWSAQMLVLPSQCRGQPRSQWLYSRDGGQDMATNREGYHATCSTKGNRGKQGNQRNSPKEGNQRETWDSWFRTASHLRSVWGRRG